MKDSEYFTKVEPHYVTQSFPFSCSQAKKFIYPTLSNWSLFPSYVISKNNSDRLGPSLPERGKDSAQISNTSFLSVFANTLLVNYSHSLQLCQNCSQLMKFFAVCSYSPQHSNYHSQTLQFWNKMLAERNQRQHEAKDLKLLPRYWEWYFCVIIA